MVRSKLGVGSTKARSHLLLVHHVEAGNREREDGAAAALKEKPDRRSLAHCGWLNAAHLRHVCAGRGSATSGVVRRVMLAGTQGCREQWAKRTALAADVVINALAVLLEDSLARLCEIWPYLRTHHTHASGRKPLPLLPLAGMCCTLEE